MKELTLQTVQSAHFQQDEESIAEGAEIIMDTIEDSLKSGKGCVIGRHGTTELQMIFTLQKSPKLHNISAGEALELYSGIFPNTKDTHQQWYTEYKEASSKASVLAMGWFAFKAQEEWEFIQKINPAVKKIPLRALEPYYLPCSYHWTQVLENHRVCVVSSFADTMKKQVSNKKAIWGDWADTLLPDRVEWSFVRAYYCPTVAKGKCEWPNGIKSWKQALETLESNVLSNTPEIVLIGCGALAMPLANRLAKKGLVCIVLGGAIQTFFGIKGKRWETNKMIQQFWNKAWVFPDTSEMPGGYKEIEEGCYW